MNTSGQVSVELKLILDNLRKQAKDAADILRGALKSGTNDLSPGIEKATKRQGEMTEAVKKTTAAMKDQKAAALEAWKASLPKPQVYGVGGTAAPKPNYSGYGPTMNPTQGPMGPGGGLATNPNAQAGAGVGSGGLPPGFRPVALGNNSGGPNNNNPWRSPLAIAAQVGAALAGFRVAIGLAGYALRALLSPIRMIIAAANAASALYAKATMSGAGLGYSSSMSVMAGIFGVSQEQVMLFGKSMLEMSEKVKHSSQIFVRTNPTLTALSWQIKLLQADFGALVSQISATFAPVVQSVIVMFDKMARGASDLMEKMGPLMDFLAGFISGAIDAVTGGGGVNQPSQPVGSANRMASSAWEKMGLVLGNGGQGHMQAVARNTARMSVLMEKMVGVFTNPNEMTPIDSYNHSRP